MWRTHLHGLELHEGLNQEPIAKFWRLCRQVRWRGANAHYLARRAFRLNGPNIYMRWVLCASKLHQVALVIALGEFLDRLVVAAVSMTSNVRRSKDSLATDVASAVFRL